MKRIMLSMLAVAMLVAFSAPAFAGEEKKKDEKKGGKLTQMVYGEEKREGREKGRQVIIGSLLARLAGSGGLPIHRGDLLSRITPSVTG